MGRIVAVCIRSVPCYRWIQICACTVSCSRVASRVCYVTFGIATDQRMRFSNMALDLNRRRFVLGAHMTVLTVAASPLLAQSRSVWSAENAFDALLSDTARIIDVRTHKEWQETGVGAGVWPISMHASGFPDRLFRAKELSGDRTVGLICATGGRSASLLRALRQAGYSATPISRKGCWDQAKGLAGSHRTCRPFRWMSP